MRYVVREIVREMPSQATLLCRIAFLQNLNAVTRILEVGTLLVASPIDIICLILHTFFVVYYKFTV